MNSHWNGKEGFSQKWHMTQTLKNQDFSKGAENGILSTENNPCKVNRNRVPCKE